MVILDVTTGLRRSELFALKWLDVDFSNLTIDVQRSIYGSLAEFVGRRAVEKAAPRKSPTAGLSPSA